MHMYFVFSLFFGLFSFVDFPSVLDTVGQILLVKLTNRPGFSGTVPVWDTLSRNPERCLRDAKLSRFGFRSPGPDRMLSKFVYKRGTGFVCFFLYWLLKFLATCARLSCTLSLEFTLNTAIMSYRNLPPCYASMYQQVPCTRKK